MTPPDLEDRTHQRRVLAGSVLAYALFLGAWLKLLNHGYALLGAVLVASTLATVVLRRLEKKHPGLTDPLLDDPPGRP